MSSILSGATTHSFQNVTFDSTDMALQYSGGWSHSDSSALNGESLASSSQPGDVVFLNLPENATAFYYFGLKQPRGGRYNVCIDYCGDYSTSFDLIDAHENSSSSSVTLLHQKTGLDPSTQHSIALMNVADARFANTSTMTVRSFVVTVAKERQENAPALRSMRNTSHSSHTHATLSSEPLSNTPSLFPSASTPFGPSSTSASASASAALTENAVISKTLGPRLALAGIIASSIIVFLTVLFAFMYFMRRRKRRLTAPYGADPEHWAARFFGEKGTRKSIFADWSSPSGLERRRTKSRFTGGNESRRGQGEDKMEERGRHIGHRRNLTEEVLLPHDPSITRQESSDEPTLTPRIGDHSYSLTDLDDATQPPPYTLQSPAQKPRRSVDGLSTILREQLGAPRLSLRLLTPSQSSVSDSGQVSPTRSPSRKPRMVSSPLARNPAWTYATLSHIHANDNAPARRPRPNIQSIQRSSTGQSRNKSARQALPALPSHPGILPPAPSLGSHVAEAYARVRERAHLTTVLGTNGSVDGPGGGRDVNADALASPKRLSTTPESVLEGYYAEEP